MTYQLFVDQQSTKIIPVWGDPLENAISQIKTCFRHPNAFKSALMADHHKGYAMPIGGVLAYYDCISPSGVGYDIACGNKAVLLDMTAEDVVKDISKIMDKIYTSLSFGVGMINKEEVPTDIFDDDAWKIESVNKLKDLAREQLGTIGSGNHFCDIFLDEQDRVWCGIHFGSRGFGHKIASHYIREGGGVDGMDVEPVVLHDRSWLGQEYLQCMNLAGRYASAGRDWVCQKIARLLGTRILHEVHNHHNFAWKENHFGQDVYVVRKGATPAFPGQQCFIGGSMGDDAVIAEGIDTEESKLALRSTVHGAGRVLSRNEAAGKKRWNKREKRFERKTEGKVSKEMMSEWIKEKGVELRGAGTDESPHCYKRLSNVIRYHDQIMNVLHTLRPIAVAMAGDNEFDPFRLNKGSR